MRNEKEQAEHLAATAPKLTEAELEKLNELFPTYIFRRRRTGEIWTSCCGKYIKLPPTEWDGKFSSVMETKHEQEPRLGVGSTRYCHMSANDTVEDRTLTECPFCGKLAAVKELGRTGNRQNLRNWQRAVIFRQYRGALWARAYECEKDYEGPESFLTSKPAFRLSSVYRFQIGKAERSAKGYFSGSFDYYKSMTDSERKSKILIYEPFNWSCTLGMSYDLVNANEIQISDFKYCEFETYANQHSSCMKFLAVAALYPRQTEMLMKAGMLDAVEDMVRRDVRNSRAFDWEKEEPLSSFDLTKSEMQEFLNTSRDVRILRYYKRLKKQGEKLTMQQIEDDICRLDSKAADKLIKWCREHQIKLTHVVNYLESFISGCHAGGGYRSFGSIYKLWQDYLTAADALHYETWKLNVTMPADLYTEHDKATTAHRNKLEKERRASEKEKLELQRKAYEERLALLEKKYAFSADGLTIVVPKNADEIISEGKALEHCVSGYADRHMKGVLAILFLRKETAQNKSFVTIEMNGNTLVQIHGYRNEGLYTVKGRRAPDPREVHKEFLELWLDWLKRNSPRDKEGNPINKKTRKKKEVTAA